MLGLQTFMHCQADHTVHSSSAGYKLLTAIHGNRCVHVRHVTNMVPLAPSLVISLLLQQTAATVLAQHRAVHELAMAEVMCCKQPFCNYDVGSSWTLLIT